MSIQTDKQKYYFLSCLSLSISGMCVCNLRAFFLTFFSAIFAFYGALLIDFLYNLSSVSKDLKSNYFISLTVEYIFTLNLILFQRNFHLQTLLLSKTKKKPLMENIRNFNVSSMQAQKTPKIIFLGFKMLIRKENSEFTQIIVTAVSTCETSPLITIT